MASSLVGFSAANAAPYSESEIMTLARILRIISSGHCTPVQCAQKRPALPPIGSHLDVQLEVDFLVEQPLHLFPRLCSDLFQHSSLRPNENALLAILFDVNAGEDAREFR